jgi:ankyrin repeat protein
VLSGRFLGAHVLTEIDADRGAARFQLWTSAGQPFGPLSDLVPDVDNPWRWWFRGACAALGAQTHASPGEPEVSRGGRTCRDVFEKDGEAASVVAARLGDAGYLRARGGTEALGEAAAAGEPASVAQLLAARADVNARDEHGRTPLLRAVEQGHRGIVKMLTGAGADVNAADTVGNTALHRAALNQHVSLVGDLLAAGARADVANGLGVTPLMNASSRGALPIVQQLLTAGAPVDTADMVGSTALMDAARADSVEVVEALLAAGADINAKSTVGLERYRHTALSLARTRGQDSEVTRLLLSRNPAMRHPPMDATPRFSVLKHTPPRLRGSLPDLTAWDFTGRAGPQYKASFDALGRVAAGEDPFVAS